MTNKEIEKIRCMVAMAAHVPPDNIKIILAERIENAPTLYAFTDNNDCNLIIGFNSIPTFKDIRNDIKDTYLAMKEWEWEENHPI